MCLSEVQTYTHAYTPGTHIKTHRIYLLSKTQSDRMHLTILVCSKTWNKFGDSHGCCCAGRIWICLLLPWTHLLSEPASFDVFLLSFKQIESLGVFSTRDPRKYNVAKSKCSVSAKRHTLRHTINIRYFWPKHSKRSNENSIFERIQKRRRRRRKFTAIKGNVQCNAHAHLNLQRIFFVRIVKFVLNEMNRTSSSSCTIHNFNSILSTVFSSLLLFLSMPFFSSFSQHKTSH